MDKKLDGIIDELFEPCSETSQVERLYTLIKSILDEKASQKLIELSSKDFMHRMERERMLAKILGGEG